MIGYASWRVWKNGKDGRRKIPLLVYTINLIVNWMWSIVYFGFGTLIGAIINILVMLVFISTTGILFYRVDKVAGYLFIPYFIYVTYALIVCSHNYYLNFIQ
jgi:translocator protein